jgi:hypothetical protein
MGNSIHKKWLALGGGALIAIACGQNLDDDPTASEYGSYEQPLLSANGVIICSSAKKSLVCHIPPGNPANAHSICIGNPAVAPHVTHHHDGVGACAPGTPGDIPIINKKHGPPNRDPTAPNPNDPASPPVLGEVGGDTTSNPPRGSTDLPPKDGTGGAQPPAPGDGTSSGTGGSAGGSSGGTGGGEPFEGPGAP